MSCPAKDERVSMIFIHAGQKVHDRLFLPSFQIVVVFL